MSTHTIDSTMARRLIEANAIQGASIIGQPGGWSVMLKMGTTEKLLGTQRTDKPRLWRSLDTCMSYLMSELHISLIDALDGRSHSEATSRTARVDSSERMKRAHEAAAHDKWFRAQVDDAIKEADDLSTKWVSNEAVKKQSATHRVKWAQLVAQQISAEPTP